jgi:hypothetical protein
MGFDDHRKTTFLSIENAHWVTIVDGTRYEHIVQVDGYPSGRLAGFGTHTGNDRPAVMFPGIDTELWRELMLGGYVRIWYQGASVLYISLAGSRAALAATIECEQFMHPFDTPQSSGNPYPGGNPYPTNNSYRKPNT